uniref:G-protein coupled receptors family 1 profile domain-containing protein n=1 Tax=Plectus sambesii TaxID=2011161 RepID=A0A914VZZ0_9BILA
MNGSTSSATMMMKRDEEIIRRFAPMAMMLTMVLALLGNGFLAFVIRSMAGAKGLNSVQILILNNCVADILFALLTILPTCVEFLTANEHVGNDLSCRIVAFVRLVPMYASPFLLVAISFDRFLAICRPWSAMKRRTHMHARSYAATAWLLALLFASPNLLIYGLKRARGARYCIAIFVTDWHNQLYVTYFSVLAWLVPSIISGLLYAAVCRCVWTELTGVRRTIARPPARKESIDRTGPTGRRLIRARLSTVCEAQIREIGRQRLTTVKLTMTIVACNFILWAPFCITNLIVAFQRHAIPATVATLIILVGNLNSCVNPWIYMLFQRHQVKKVLMGVRKLSRTGTYTVVLSSDRRLSLDTRTKEMRSRTPRSGSFAAYTSTHKGAAASANAITAPAQLDIPELCDSPRLQNGSRRSSRISWHLPDATGSFDDSYTPLDSLTVAMVQHR